MHRSITITGMHRPELFRQALQTLSRNDLEGWRIHIRIEPTSRSREFAEIAAALLPAGSFRFGINPERLGILGNPRDVIDEALTDGSGFNLHIEEDLLLAPDATSMALWYQRNHRPHWLLLGLLAGPCGWSSMLSNRNFPSQLVETQVLNSIGIAFRREEWLSELQPAWTEPATPAREFGHAQWRTHWGWDWSIYGVLLAKPGLRTVAPLLARATHNGPIGQYSKPDFHDRTFNGLPLHEGRTAEYGVVDPDALPFEVRSHLNGFEESTTKLLELERLGRRLHEPLARTAVRRAKRFVRSFRSSRSQKA